MDTNALTEWAKVEKLKLKLVKDTAKRTARAEFEITIQNRAKELYANAEREFAKILLQLHEAGVSDYDLRDQVLDTQDWGTWKKWRDLAGIKPAREAAQEVKMSGKPYRLEDGEWYAVRNEEGEIDPIRLDILATKDGFAIWPPMDEQEHGYDSYVKNFGRNQKRFNDFIVTAFKKYGDDPFEKGTI